MNVTRTDIWRSLKRYPSAPSRSRDPPAGGSIAQALEDKKSVSVQLTSDQTKGQKKNNSQEASTSWSERLLTQKWNRLTSFSSCNAPVVLATLLASGRYLRGLASLPQAPERAHSSAAGLVSWTRGFTALGTSALSWAVSSCREGKRDWRGPGGIRSSSERPFGAERLLGGFGEDPRLATSSVKTVRLC